MPKFWLGWDSKAIVSSRTTENVPLSGIENGKNRSALTLLLWDVMAGLRLVPTPV